MFYRTLLFLALTFCSPFLRAAELGELDPKQLVALQQKHKALVIDIRTAQEWAATGTIPGSQRLQFFNADGDYDAGKWLADFEKLRNSPDQPVVLVCRSGNRSGMVGNFLTQKLDMQNIYHLKNGIMPWLKAGNPTSPNCINLRACKQ